MKFRKKPVVIEAWQNKKDNPIPNWLQGIGVGVAGQKILIQTLEGAMTANENDWVICGIQGECYPCKPDIFNATYEKVGEETL